MDRRGSGDGGNELIGVSTVPVDMYVHDYCDLFYDAVCKKWEKF